MCSCHSIPECCVMFSGVKMSMGSFVLFLIFVLGLGFLFRTLTASATLITANFGWHSLRCFHLL